MYKNRWHTTKFVLFLIKFIIIFQCVMFLVCLFFAVFWKYNNAHLIYECWNANEDINPKVYYFSLEGNFSFLLFLEFLIVITHTHTDFTL